MRRSGAPERTPPSAVVNAVQELAPAKVNLDLAVIGRRADGYHDLDSLVVFAALADRLVLRDADELSLEICGPFCEALACERDNLVLRAARAFADATGHPLKAAIRLEKCIPAAAGLGGGSADAAAALRGLNRLWDQGIPLDSLLPLAMQLGADVPVCLASRPARMSGIGERLEFLGSMPELHVLLVNPNRAVPTGPVFAGLAGAFSVAPRPPVPVADRAALLQHLRERRNDLEAPARRLVPEIATMLGTLADQPGCALARMSGSGATCFGLFENEDALRRAEAGLRARHPGWWVQATRTRP